MQKGFSNTSFRKDFDLQTSYNQIFILKPPSVSDSNLDGNYWDELVNHCIRYTSSMELVSFDSSVQYHLVIVDSCKAVPPDT